MYFKLNNNTKVDIFNISELPNNILIKKLKFNPNDIVNKLLNNNIKELYIDNYSNQNNIIIPDSVEYLFINIINNKELDYNIILI